MRRKDENPEPGRASLPWTRSALVSLWVIAFALLGGALALRWDALVSSLAGAPLAHAERAER
jgi:hypothetical protein